MSYRKTSLPIDPARGFWLRLLTPKTCRDFKGKQPLVRFWRLCRFQRKLDALQPISAAPHQRRPGKETGQPIPKPKHKCRRRLCPRRLMPPYVKWHPGHSLRESRQWPTRTWTLSPIPIIPAPRFSEPIAWSLRPPCVAQGVSTNGSKSRSVRSNSYPSSMHRAAITVSIVLRTVITPSCAQRARKSLRVAQTRISPAA